MRLNQEDFVLRELLAEVMKLFAPQAKGKRIELICSVDGDVPATLRADRARIRQILTNLVGNSVKFTEKGEVVVKVTRGACAEGKLRLVFQVSDTGIGIPEHINPRVLFEPFSQADGSLTRKYGGTGLGLTISKQLIELMEGKIEVHSVAGKGSTFRFDILVAAAAENIAPQPVSA
jgi:two-component system, sensor histidine kinase and response regulator